MRSFGRIALGVVIAFALMGFVSAIVSILGMPIEESAHAVFGFAMGLGLLALYFFPTGVAASRRHHATLSVFLLNLLLGWTVVVWIVCLIWANTGRSPHQA